MVHKSSFGQSQADGQDDYFCAAVCVCACVCVLVITTYVYRAFLKFHIIIIVDLLKHGVGWLLTLTAAPSTDSRKTQEWLQYWQLLTEAMWLGLTIDEVWVVAALAQFHHGVHQARHVGGAPFRQELKVALQNGTVVLFLDVCQFHLSTHTKQELFMKTPITYVLHLLHR